MAPLKTSYVFSNGLHILRAHKAIVPVVTPSKTKSMAIASAPSKLAISDQKVPQGAKRYRIGAQKNQVQLEIEKAVDMPESPEVTGPAVNPVTESASSLTEVHFPDPKKAKFLSLFKAPKRVEEETSCIDEILFEPPALV